MYCPPRLMCVPTLPWRKWIVRFPFPRVQRLILVLFPQNFFSFSSPILDFFAEVHQKKMLKMRVAVWHYTYFGVPLYLITNHATDAIKAVVHTANMKFRKLKKNNVRNTNKTRQLKQEVIELYSMGIHAGAQRLDREQKFCGHKTSTGCWTLKIWQFIFAEVV